MRLGLIVNPVAGIGGPLGFKGSDGMVDQAIAAGGALRAEARILTVLEALAEYRDRLSLFTWGGAMGENVARQAGYSPRVLGQPVTTPSTDCDTLAAARMMASHVDLLVFAGGDGTARNLVDAIGLSVPVLGVPAGVKIHSAVYAVNPQSAAEVLRALLEGRSLPLTDAEVRDIDEAAFREGRVKTRSYGELRVPGSPRFLQQVKCGGREVEALVLADIAAGVIDQLEDDHFYVIGPGTTTRAVMDALGQPSTLLGVDLLLGRRCVGLDLDAASLQQRLDGKAFTLIVTAIGGQGHILGRGNQQITPALVRAAGKSGLWVIATPSKLEEIGGRPLQVDTGDPFLDEALSGWIRVMTGFQRFEMVPVGA